MHLLLSFLLATWMAIVSTSVENDGHVLVLGKSSFDDALKSHDLIMVEFYAPWCGHCKALAPEYAKAAEELDGTEAKLAKVDCTVETDVCNGQGVQGYPTIKVFRKGQPSDYTKARKADVIVGYMKKQLLPVLSDVTKDNLEEFKNKDKVVVVGYFEGKDDAAYETYKSIANKFRDGMLFGVVVDSDVANAEGVTVPGVVLYKQFDEMKNIFPENVPEDALKIQGDDVLGSLTEEAISKFLSVNSVPLINDIGPENYGKYVESGLYLGYLFVADDEQRKAVGPAVEAVARTHRGKINFVYIDANQYGGHARNLNVKEEWPAFAIEEPQKHLKFPFTSAEGITEETLLKFTNDLLSGELKPSIKSEPIPESNDGPVKVVVADSFSDIVLDTAKDVLMEFYAPWCGHCKRLAPIYEQLGKHFASVPSVLIAKMDATENDIPPDQDFSIEGFPTIKLFKAKTNEIVDYQGERSAEGFIEFLKENASIPFDVPDVLSTSEEGDEEPGDHDHDHEHEHEHDHDADMEHDEL